MEERKKRFRLWPVLAAVILAVAVGYLVFHYVNASRTPVASSDLPAIGGPFSLTDQNGHKVTDADLRGHFSLIYFGYTYCPDICATALTSMTKALDLLGRDGESVVPVFITIDPERDTIEQMKMYAGFFHPRLLALTGSAEKTAAAASAYRVYYAPVKKSGGDPDDYLIDHTSIIYLMGPGGNYRAHFTEETPPEAMAERIREVL